MTNSIYVSFEQTMDVLTVLKGNVPGDVYDKVFKNTMMHLFKECDVINGLYSALFDNNFKYKTMFDDFVVFQNDHIMKFAYNDEFSNNKLEWYSEDGNQDILKLMYQRMIRFKYLKIERASNYTLAYINHSDFVSYTYNKYVSHNHFLIEKSNEVTIKEEQMSTNKILKLAQKYPDKSFVVSVGVSSDHDLAKIIDVAKLCKNVKVNVDYTIFNSFQHTEPREIKSSKYYPLFEDPQSRISLTTSVSIYRIKRISIELLAAQLYQIGYDTINKFNIHGGCIEEEGEFAISPGIVGKMTNLERLSIEGNVTVNKDTIGDLSGLHKLRRLIITSDGCSNEWLSACLPESIEEIELFKSVKKMPQYYPIRLGKKVRYFVIKHENNHVVYSLNTKDFVFTNPRCNVFFKDTVLEPREMEPEDEYEDEDGDEDEDEDEESGSDRSESDIDMISDSSNEEY